MQARAQRLENAVNVQQLVASVEAGTKRRIGEVLEDTDLETEFLRYINPPQDVNRYYKKLQYTETFVGDVKKVPGTLCAVMSPRLKYYRTALFDTCSC
jgi:hypothetical protein